MSENVSCGAMQTSLRRHESDTQLVAGPCGGDALCVSHQRTVSSLSHAACLKALRSSRGVHVAIADGCTFGSRMAVHDGDATEVQAVMITCSELGVSRHLPVCDEPL